MTNTQKRKETIELTIFLLWPIIAAVSSFATKANLLASVLIFYGLPSLYLSYKMKENIKNAAIFSLIAGILPVIMIDYLGHITKAWVVPVSILPWRVFGVVTLEVIVWSIGALYVTVMFYEYFLERHITHKLVTPRLKYLLIIIIALFSVFLAKVLTSPQAVHIPHFYMWFGLIFILLPIIAEGVNSPQHLTKFFKAQAYFFYLNVIYEITALKQGWWFFPGQEFIGWVSISGVTFPLEELFFYIMLMVLALLTYFEFFERESKKRENK